MRTTTSDRFRALREKVSAAMASPAGRRLARFGRWFLTGAIVLFLGIRLTQIGWGEIVSALPTQPLFYLFFALLYFSLPVAETVIYRLIWPATRKRDSFQALIKKRVFNRDVLGYSGELYLVSWARRATGLRDGEILRNVRDVNILSSASSTSVAISLLAIFLLLGQVNVQAWVDRPMHYVMGAAIALAVITVALWPFRRYIFSMAWRTALLVVAIFGARLLAGQALQIGMWAVVLPEVPLATWFTFAAVSLIISRIPFLPSQDLVFAGAGIELARVLGLPGAEIAGMLLVAGVLDKIMNLLLFAFVTYRQRGPVVTGDLAMQPQTEVSRAESLKT